MRRPREGAKLGTGSMALIYLETIGVVFTQRSGNAVDDFPPYALVRHMGREGT